MSNLMNIALARNPFCCAQSDDPVLSIKANYIRRWQGFVTFVIICSILVELMTLAYTRYSSGVSNLLTASLCDLIFLVDVVLRFYISYYDCRGLERKAMSHAFRRVRLVDLKRVDPESGLPDADIEEPPVTTFKAKPRMSLVRGSVAGTDAFDLPPGLKELKKRMTMPNRGSVFDDDGDSLDTDSSGMIVPAVTYQKKSSSTSASGTLSNENFGTDSSETPDYSPTSGHTLATENKSHDSSSREELQMHEIRTRQESSEEARSSTLSDTTAAHQTDSREDNYNQNNLDSRTDPQDDLDLVWESNFSLAAPSHASILYSGIHVAEESDEVSRIKSFTIHPFSWFNWVFSEVMCLFGFLSGWLIIYQAAFQDHNNIVLGLNYVIDVFYLLQIYIKFHVSFYDKNGDLIKDLPVIRRHYIHCRYKFALDIMSAAPLEILALAAPAGAKMIVLSMFRLFRLSRLFRVYQYFKELEQQLNVNMLFVRLCKFVVFVTLAVHLYSCLWYKVACPFGECKDTSWIEFKSNLEAYVTSMYWCLATVTSTGYGDVSPHTESEVWVSIVAMVFGKFMFGFVLANIASTLANAETERVGFDHKYQSLMSHMSDQDVPKPLQQRVSDYYSYMWHRNRGRGVKNLFTDTPDAMRAEILLNVTRDMLESIPFLEHAEENFLRQIAPKVDKVLFLPGDFISIKGDTCQKMYYIYRGEVEVVNEKNPSEVCTVLSKGDIVGEVSLVYCVPRQVSLRAVNYVDLFSLSKSDLDKVLENFPDLKCDIQSQAQQRFRHIIDALKRGK